MLRLSDTGARRTLRRGVLSIGLVLAIGAPAATDALAQRAGWSRGVSTGIVSGPLPVPDPGSMPIGPPAYTQTLGDTMPDPGDIAPDNGQMFTVFGRRF
jgi:hypothetical protein